MTERYQFGTARWKKDLDELNQIFTIIYDTDACTETSFTNRYEGRKSITIDICNRETTDKYLDHNVLFAETPIVCDTKTIFENISQIVTRVKNLGYDMTLLHLNVTEKGKKDIFITSNEENEAVYENWTMWDYNKDEIQCEDILNFDSDKPFLLKLIIN